jgi:pimeloyl-ACP methyl ester carboxylesterase
VPAGGQRGPLLGACWLFLAALTAGSSLLWAADPLEIRVGDLVFDAIAAGPEEGELVLLLHGFPQTGHSYRHQLRSLGEAGYRAVAPDQRGYSPGARPTDVAAYAMPRLVSDVVGMAAALGRERFHLVGHDWGGAVAWATATFHPERVLSLSVLSTPHYVALGRASADPRSDQSQRSSYFTDFAAPGAEERFLADDKAVLRGVLQGAGSPADQEVYLQKLGSSEAMRAALNWYRALVASRASASAPGGSTGATSGGAASIAPPPVAAPTLYLWGSEDSAFGREPAAATADLVAAPYEFHVLEGNGHWLLEERAETVSRLLVDHVRSSFPDLRTVSPARHFDPDRAVFTSAATPSFHLPLPEGFVYLGRLEFPLKGVAWVDRHLFAELDGRKILRTVVLQFEGFLEGATGVYSFGIPSGDAVAGSNYRFSPAPVALGSHDYVHNTWAFDQRASAEENPGLESDRLVRFLHGRGLEFDDAWIMSRFVRAVGPEARSEVILFYLVPLGERGHSLDEFPDEQPPSAGYDGLSETVTRESIEIFGKLEEASPAG